MKHNKNFRPMAAFAVVFYFLAIAKAQGEAIGFIPFDFPNAPRPKIELNFDGTLITLVAKTAKGEPEIAELISMVKGVHLRGYDSKTEGLDEITRYYGQILKKRKWETIVKVKKEAETVQVNVLLGGEMVHGIFVIITGQTETLLLNIVGQIHPERIGELLANLDGIGVDIPQLRSVMDEDLDNPEHSEAENTTTPLPSTQFVDGEGEPIHEVRIQGNREISTAEIKHELEKGPNDLRNSIKLMKSVLPFRKVKSRIHEEKGMRIATITVFEKELVNSKFDLSGGFNRVDGLRLGPSLEWSKQPDLWTPSRLKLFGELTYGFSNKVGNYMLGVQTTESFLSVWNLTVTAQIHRLTEVRDIDILPNGEEQFAMAFLYGGDFRDYYLRDGSEISIRWKPSELPHALTLRVLDENHRSLVKSTDWNLFRRGAVKEENRDITGGHLRSAALRYDFDQIDRSNDAREGWRHTFEVEHSNADVGSDFDFTRFIANFRLYQRVAGNSVALRLKVGVSTEPLPVQRQFIIGGPGTLRGYELYEFAGDQMALFNLEYYHNLGGDDLSILFFIDAGHVWNDLGAFNLEDVKVNMGVGVEIVDDEDLNFTLTLAQALEWEQTPRFTFKRKPRLALRWTRMF